MRGLVLVLLATLACTPESPYYQHHYQNQFPGEYHYDVSVNQTLIDGVRVDDRSRIGYDMFDLIKQTDQVESCLADLFGEVPLIPQEVIDTAHCDSKTFPWPLLRQDLVVKIAANWEPSCDGGQRLPAPAPEELCAVKPPCPRGDGKGCFWRAGIQDNHVIVVTPNLALYKDPLIRMVTGCNNPWVSALAVCAAR